MTDRELLEELYRAAVAAVDPGPATAEALAALPAPEGRLWILALGKAALPMAEAATRVVRARGWPLAGGLVVAPATAPAPDAALPVVAGDHPQPGPASLAAATLLGEVAARVALADEVWVLLSGGTTSLIGAPLPPVTPDALHRLYGLLLGAGLDIGAMNRVRKRFTRWGGGKLAAALPARRIRQFVVSDVIGDDMAAIASGPCVPDPTRATDVRELLVASGLWPQVPQVIRDLLGEGGGSVGAETPKPGDPVFERVETTIVSSNGLALEAAARRAASLGLAPEIDRTPLDGEASSAGASVAAALSSYRADTVTQRSTPRRCLIRGGETTVTLGDHPGLGGRSQELALAAAQVMAAQGLRGTLLAAGTDGRDGPTDAAGAVVDAGTWSRIAAAGRDPARDLARHDAYPALDAAGALLRPGLTGTNVMDVVIGVV